MNDADKERYLLWRREKKEEKRQRNIQRKEEARIDKNLKRLEKIETNNQMEALMKKAKEEHVKNAINNLYYITNDNKDRIPSMLLGFEMNNEFRGFIDSKIIKGILLNVPGITFKRYKEGHFFCGLKPK